jgi:uncharacterized protein YdeI (YjbR/CyaY-like superfamily)
MVAAQDAGLVEVRNRTELRDWLSRHHGRTDSVWLVTYKKSHDDYLPFGEVVEELICWGWVDSSVRTVDADRMMHLISPRSPASAWSAANKRNVAQARASGAMTEAGETAVRAGESNGMWTFLDDVERLEVPSDLATALDAAGTRGAWDSWPPSVRRATLELIKRAKREPTRAARIREVVESARQGLRPKPFR